LLDWLSVHENNQMIFFTDVLSRQIPTSRAANAFNSFRKSMLNSEIVRLCTLWDRLGEDRESIPTIVELIKDPKVRRILVEDAYHRRADIRAGDTASKQKQRARYKLRKVQDDGNKVFKSDRLIRVRNHQDSKLAHALTGKAVVGKPPAYAGDAEKLLTATIKVVDGLHQSLNGKGFMWHDARQQFQRQAQKLWGSCKFVNVPRRLRDSSGAGPEYAIFIDHHLLVFVRRSRTFNVHGPDHDSFALTNPKVFAIHLDDAVIEKDQFSPLITRPSNPKAPSLRIGSIAARCAAQ
jgi:hypothetical protein